VYVHGLCVCVCLIILMSRSFMSACIICAVHSSGMWHVWAIRKTRPEPYIRRFAGYPRTGGAAQDVHVAPGYGPWKQTSSR